MKKFFLIGLLFILAFLVSCSYSIEQFKKINSTLVYYTCNNKSFSDEFYSYETYMVTLSSTPGIVSKKARNNYLEYLLKLKHKEDFIFQSYYAGSYFLIIKKQK